MPLNSRVLSLEIEKSIQQEIKKQYPTAKKQPAQKIIAKAIANGVYVGATSGVGMGPIGPPTVLTGIGITGLSESNMTSIAMKEMKKRVGKTGVAQKPFFKGVFLAIVNHLQTQALLISPFGGPIVSYVGVTQEIIFNNIKSVLPESYLKSKAGEHLFQAVAKAVSDDITLKGKGFVPPTGGVPPGPVIAKIT